MIPEYKRFHGAVFAELIDTAPGALSIEEWPEKGRLTSYVVNGRVGLHIKHSGARIGPWQFTFTNANFEDIESLRQRCDSVFVVLVCWLDGMVCLTDAEFHSMAAADSDRVWIRVERRKGEQYGVSGPSLELPGRKPKGVDAVVHAASHVMQPRRTELPHTSSFSLKTYLRRLWEGIVG